MIGLVRAGKCKKMIKYQSRSIEFSGINASIFGSKIVLGQLNTKLRNMNDISEIALALDDFQYNLCNNLTNPELIKHLGSKDLANYTKTLLGAHACMLLFRTSLEAFKQDPKGQAANLDKTLDKMQNFVEKVTPELNTETSRILVSNALSAVDIDEQIINNQLGG